MGGNNTGRKTRAIYFLSCAVVIIVLAACVATVVTAIYFSDNSPWRDDTDGDPDTQCPENESAGEEGDTVDTKVQLGTIQGKLVKTSFGSLVERYLGIPFAEPPFGGNRFKEPKAYTKPYTRGVYKAFEYSDVCVQFPLWEGAQSRWEEGQGISEDCLYLNVWVPRPRRENRAVMVWIHGGSFRSETGSDLRFDGSVLSSYGDVIVVSINFRLGVMVYQRGTCSH